MPGAQETAKPMLGGIFFLFAMLKNLVIVALAGIIWGAGIPVGLSSWGVLFTVMPVIGLIGSLIAMILCFMRKMWMIAVVMGILSLVGSALFGLLILIGPLGLVFALLGLIMLLLSKKEFAN
jgi:hypothetical protein